MLNKNLAGLFAIFSGLFGVHRFYLGQWFRGVMQFAFFWGSVFLVNVSYGYEESLFSGILVAMSVIIPVITGIVFLSMPEKRWLAKYDPAALEEINSDPGYAAGPRITDTSELKAEGIRYYRTADYDLAIEAFQDAIDLDLGDAGTHFNLACSYAQLGQYGEALRHLEHSVTFGLPKPERIEKHPALAGLRKQAAYRTFRSNNFRRLNLIELTAPGPKATEEEVLEDFNTPPPADVPRDAKGTMSVDLLEQITRLRELHDAGVLTQQEYQRQKEKLMG